MIKLTDEERRKFAAYCKQEAISFDSFAEQFKKIPGLANSLGSRERNKAAAFAIVGAEIDPDNWEKMTITK